jgi:hypothetical protein
MTTVQENNDFLQKGYSNEPRKLEICIDFKATLQLNLIKNNPVTLENIKIAESIFGLDIGYGLGKYTTYHVMHHRGGT